MKRYKEKSIILQIVALLLFLSQHFVSMFYFNGFDLIFFGIRLTALFGDIVLWSAITFQILSIISLLMKNEVFIIERKKNEIKIKKV